MTEDQYFWIGLSVIGGMILFALLTTVGRREPEPPKKQQQLDYGDDDE